MVAVILSSQYDVRLSIGSITDNNSNEVPQAHANVLNIGYFPNVNHAQAIIGLKNGDYQKIIQNNTSNQSELTVNEFIFSAGPSAIEALNGGQIDAAYVGPTPAISGYISTGGEGLRIISGAASGGSVLVVREDSNISSVRELGEKKFATPQIGNTQDVALRTFLLDKGFNTADRGGNVTVVPVKPGDILTLMIKKEIDGAWVPEPWGARLVKDAGGKILLDERELWPNGKFASANIVVRTNYLKENPDIIKGLLEAHVDKTLWISERLAESNTTENGGKVAEVIDAFNGGLTQITGKPIPDDELRDALSRIDFTYDPLPDSLRKIAYDTYELGFLRTDGESQLNISGIYDLALLNEVLDKKGLERVQ